MTYKPIDERLLVAETAIHNAQTDEVLREALNAYGYDDAVLQSGADLLATARAAHQKQVTEYGEQYEATEAFQQAFDAANEGYLEHIELARIALRDRTATQAKLKLLGRRKATFSAWRQQALNFYDGAMKPEMLEELGRFNVTEDGLRAVRNQIEALGELNSRQETEKGEAQEATEERDAAVAALDAWMRDFRDVARIALADRPQQLEKIGIVA